MQKMLVDCFTFVRNDSDVSGLAYQRFLKIDYFPFFMICLISFGSMVFSIYLSNGLAPNCGS